MTANELLPCPWCGSAPFFHPELSDGSTRLECGGDCCPMEETYTPRGSREFVITVWNRRPFPAAGADPEVVEAACREICKMRGHGPDTLHWHTEWETDRADRPWPQDALLSNGKPAHYGWRIEAPYVEAVARALLSNATDEMPPARRAEVTTIARANIKKDQQ